MWKRRKKLHFPSKVTIPFPKMLGKNSWCPCLFSFPFCIWRKNRSVKLSGFFLLTGFLYEPEEYLMHPYASYIPQKPYGMNYDPSLNVVNNTDSIFLCLCESEGRWQSMLIGLKCMDIYCIKYIFRLMLCSSPYWKLYKNQATYPEQNK